MSDSVNIYYVIGPLLVFGPLFLLILYNFGVLELLKIPADIRRRRKLDREEADRFHVEHARKRGAGLAGGAKGANKTSLGLFAQTVTYIWFAAVIGFFASSPPYAYNPSGAAQLKLSLSHPGQRKIKCRLRSPQELAKMPPNMRAPKSCPRERWPVHLEIDIDSKTVMRESAAPKGLSHDGPSIFYRVHPLAPGTHVIAMRLREREGDGFDFDKTLSVTLRPGQVLAVEFHAAKGGFVVQ